MAANLALNKHADVIFAPDICEAVYALELLIFPSLLLQYGALYSFQKFAMQGRNSASCSGILNSDKHPCCSLSACASAVTFHTPNKAPPLTLGAFISPACSQSTQQTRSAPMTRINASRIATAVQGHLTGPRPGVPNSYVQPSGRQSSSPLQYIATHYAAKPCRFKCPSIGNVSPRTT